MQLDWVQPGTALHDLTAEQKKIALLFGSLLHDVGKLHYRNGCDKEEQLRIGAEFVGRSIAGEGDSPQIADSIIEQLLSHHRESIVENADMHPNSLSYITWFSNDIAEILLLRATVLSTETPI